MAHIFFQLEAWLNKKSDTEIYGSLLKISATAMIDVMPDADTGQRGCFKKHNVLDMVINMPDMLKKAVRWSYCRESLPIIL